MRRRESQGEWPDKRETLVHLTKDSAPGIGFPDGFSNPSSARDRLVSILREGKIRGSFLRHMRFESPIPVAVAFSEALPETIIQLANRGYSKWGIHVHKYHAFRANGGPVWYVNNRIFKAMTNDGSASEPLEIDQRLKFLLTPYAPIWQTDIRLHNGNPNDWAQEREWRVPGDFQLPIESGLIDYEVIVPDERGREYVTGLHIAEIKESDIRVITELA